MADGVARRRAGSRRATASACSPTTASSSSMRSSRPRRSGVILVPLGTKLTPHEIEFIAKDAGLRGFVYAGEFAETVRALAGGDGCRALDRARRTGVAGSHAPRGSRRARRAAARSRRRAAPGARGHLLPALHERHHGQAEGRDGAASHGGVERLQHGHVLAAPRRRREPDLHAALPRRRPRRVPAADLLHRRHDRAPRGVRSRRRSGGRWNASGARSCSACPRSTSS